MQVPFASTANQELYIVELVDGEVPSVAPEFVGIPFVSHTLSKSSGQIDSATIRPGRHRLPSRRGANSLAGDISVELGYGVYDALIEAAFCGTWTTNELRTGSVRRQFAILERHTDIGVDMIYMGCEVNTFGLALPLTEKITATFGIIGRDAVEYQLAVDAVVTPAVNFDYLTTLEGDLKEGGLSTGLATALNVNLANGIELKYGLMGRDPVGSTIGTIDASGDLSAYFDTMALYNKFLNGDDTALVVRMGNAEAPQGEYELSIPKTRLTTGSKTATGQDVIVEVGFSAAYQDGSSELILKRVPA